MTGSVPIKFRTGRYFLAQDNLGIGEPVWDHADPVVHRFGVGSGDVNPRFYPGVDKDSNLVLSYGTLIKGSLSQYGDNGFGFQDDGFIIKQNGQIILKVNALGLQLLGTATISDTVSQFLASPQGLGQLLFPLFSDKVFIGQFDRPAFAGVDVNNNFLAYRDVNSALAGLQWTFTRGGSGDLGQITQYVNSAGIYAHSLPNQPRITYSLGSHKCRGLLVEPSATNFLTQSFHLDQWSTITGLTLTRSTDAIWTNQGLNNPYTFVESATQSEHSASQSFSADPTQPLAISHYFRANTFTGTRRFVLFASSTDRTQVFGAIFDTVSGGAPVFNSNYVVGNGVVRNVTVETVANGIFKIKILGTINPSGTSATTALNFTWASLGDTPGNSNLQFTPGANTGSWCSIGDFQLEQNPYVTSYIQTVSTTLFRDVDVLNINLQATTFSQNEGVINLTFIAVPQTPVGAVVLSLQGASNGNRIDYYVAAIDTNANTLTIGTKTYANSSLSTTNSNFAVLNLAKSQLVINYTSPLIASTITNLLISGASGFNGIIRSISYE